MQLQDPKMWTEAHWKLFSILEELKRVDFKGDYNDFKHHMLYILEVMDKMYIQKDSETETLWKEHNGN